MDVKSKDIWIRDNTLVGENRDDHIKLLVRNVSASPLPSRCTVRFQDGQDEINGKIDREFRKIDKIENTVLDIQTPNIIKISQLEESLYISEQDRQRMDK